MTKRILLAVFVSHSPLWVVAFEASPAGVTDEAKLSARFDIGRIDGEAHEIVYAPVYRGEDASSKLSQLDWELKGVLFGGGQLSARITDRIRVNGGAWIALTEGSGQMEDFDWMSDDWPEWTHYSLSDVDVTDGYRFDLNLSYSILQRGAGSCHVVAGYQQDGWSWSDRGIYALYPEYGYVPYPFDGQNLIQYEQEFRMPYAGLAGRFEAAPGWTLIGDLRWSGLVAADDWDYHIARSTKFHETFDGGDMHRLALALRRDLSGGSWKDTFVTLGVQYQQIGEIRGDMTYHDLSTDERVFLRNVAGIENQTMSVSMSVGRAF